MTASADQTKRLNENAVELSADWLERLRAVQSAIANQKNFDMPEVVVSSVPHVTTSASNVVAPANPGARLPTVQEEQTLQTNTAHPSAATQQPHGHQGAAEMAAAKNVPAEHVAPGYASSREHNFAQQIAPQQIAPQHNAPQHNTAEHIAAEQASRGMPQATVKSGADHRLEQADVVDFLSHYLAQPNQEAGPSPGAFSRGPATLSPERATSDDPETRKAVPLKKFHGSEVAGLAERRVFEAGESVDPSASSSGSARQATATSRADFTSNPVPEIALAQPTPVQSSSERSGREAFLTKELPLATPVAAPTPFPAGQFPETHFPQTPIPQAPTASAPAAANPSTPASSIPASSLPVPQLHDAEMETASGAPAIQEYPIAGLINIDETGFRLAERSTSLQINRLVDRMLEKIPPTSPTSLVIGDCEPLDDSMTLAVQLAVGMAKRDLAPVLVIDAANSSAATGEFRLTGKPGLVQALEQPERVGEWVYQTQFESIHFLPGGIVSADNAAIKTSAVHRFLRTCIRQFKFVVVIGGDLNQSPGQALAAGADATYLAVDLAANDQSAIEQTVAVLNGIGARTLGCVSLEAA